ncbi:MAG: biotin--[acetyl-CoA-carboxylase] ligase [Acidobacteria bacterium]|nr:biotin--[acetyl-CoA-carboxylase] ligase [Acidobacteriota bacterium]
MGQLDIDSVRRLLPGREIQYWPSLPTTMTEAQRLANAGAPHGTVAVADEQTAGQGTHGRTWHSAPGEGLYCTVILRPKLPPDTLPVVTLALGVAAASAIAVETGVACDLRWPNDILARGRKLGGILTQLHGAAIVTGIGINVDQAAFPAELAETATSLRIESSRESRRASGRGQRRETLLAALLTAIDEHIALLEQHGRDPILRAFARSSSYVEGRRVTVTSGDTNLVGTTAGLDECGFLRLRKDNGETILILAGGVRPI